MRQEGKWIETTFDITAEDVVVYKKEISLAASPVKAELFITACGIYVAYINGARVSMPLAPGFDCYREYIPYQIYDITKILKEKNNYISISVARGWYDWFRLEQLKVDSAKRRMKALIRITYSNGEEEIFSTDKSWICCRGKCLKADIYNGEEYDANIQDFYEKQVEECVCDLDSRLILFDGEAIAEQERIKPVSSFITPKGEYVIDFGQNITGYIEFEGIAKEKEILEISHAEVLDKDGNFYTENYRAAKSKLRYVCKAGIGDNFVVNGWL